MKKNRLILLISFLFLTIIFNSSILIDNNLILDSNSVYERNVNKIPILKKSVIIINTSISINGNNELVNFVNDLEFSGNGSKYNPYVIENLTFNDSTYLEVSNTNLSLIINNCSFENTEKGIKLASVENCVMQNLTATNISNIFIEVVSSNNCTIKESIINNCGTGIKTHTNSKDINITSNTVTRCNQGIVIATVSSHLLFNNTIKYSKVVGGVGIVIGLTTDSNITSNYIKTCYTGMTLTASSNNNIDKNVISNCTSHGIFLMDSNTNNFSLNTLIENTPFNIIISDSTQNIFCFNDFIYNGLAYQVHDISGNNYTKNFWSELTGEDVNEDGYFDCQYNISVFHNIYDNYPLTNIIHNMTKPNLLTPIDNIIYNNNTINITWDKVTDFWKNQIFYSISYKTESETSWNLIDDNIIENEYLWNISSVMDNQYLINITATSDNLLQTEIISNNTILIQKYHLNEPSITEPNIGVINGKVLIKWNETFDHWNRTVEYKLYYSTTPANNWTIIEDSSFLLQNCEYTWNTYGLNINQSISLMVKAKCYESGFEINSTILNSYLINNSDHVLTEPIIITPSSIYLSKEVEIEWSRSIDSWEGYIKYSIYYSDDDGDNWYLIKENTSQNTFIWNTTLLIDSDGYKIKIVAKSSTNITNSFISSITYELINHIPSIPTIINIQEDAILFGDVVVEWSKSEVPIGYDIKYIIEFTDVSKTTWNLLSNAHITEEYSWDLSTLLNGTYYIKIIANSSEGIQSEFELRFTITNPTHKLSEPIITNIENEEVVFGTKQINWNSSVDTWNRQINYSILFSNDTGKSWWIYRENITDNYINILLSNFSDSDYKIKVIASNKDDMISESIELTIKIRNNHYIVFDSTINISKDHKSNNYFHLLTWNQSIDSREYNVSYYGYYAKYPMTADQRNNWTFIGQTDGYSLNWNTTDLKNNDKYIIKITTISSGGLEISIYKTVTILNIAHTVSIPEIFESIDITHINESITITWKESIDSWGYKVTYNIQFSFDNGTTWDELVWGLDETSYTYDTKAIFEGKYNQENSTEIDEKTAVYLIKVIAVSGQTGISSEDIIDITDIMKEAIIPELKKATPGFEFLTIISLTILLVRRKKKTSIY